MSRLVEMLQSLRGPRVEKKPETLIEPPKAPEQITPESVEEKLRTISMREKSLQHSTSHLGNTDLGPINDYLSKAGNNFQLPSDGNLQVSLLMAGISGFSGFKISQVASGNNETVQTVTIHLQKPTKFTVSTGIERVSVNNNSLFDDKQANRSEFDQLRLTLLNTLADVINPQPKTA